MINPDTPLAPGDAIARLARQMGDLAQSIGADRPPFIVDVAIGDCIDGIANLLVLIDCQAECGPVGVPMAVELGAEPIEAFMSKLQNFLPRPAGQLLH